MDRTLLSRVEQWYGAHREEMLEGADVKIEMGPGGGPFGGRIVEESA